eukprot:SAG22_NODE_1610_length_4002_cov_2.012298_5_plen_224_part_00
MTYPGICPAARVLQLAAVRAGTYEPPPHWSPSRATPVSRHWAGPLPDRSGSRAYDLGFVPAEHGGGPRGGAVQQPQQPQPAEQGEARQLLPSKQDLHSHNIIVLPSTVGIREESYSSNLNRSGHINGCGCIVCNSTPFKPTRGRYHDPNLGWGPKVLSRGMIRPGGIGEAPVSRRAKTAVAGCAAPPLLLRSFPCSSCHPRHAAAHKGERTHGRQKRRLQPDS